MERWQVEHVAKHVQKLVQITTCTSALFAKFLEEGILSQEDVETLESTFLSKSEQSMKLYMLLTGRANAYNVLLQALQETRQMGAFIILNKMSQKMERISYDENFVIGVGAYGSKVYKGRFCNRDVAVKRISLDFMDTAREERNFLVNLEWHENIARYFAMEGNGDSVLIALELCNMTLSNWMEQGKETLKISSLELLRQAGEGIAHLHDQKVVHGDIRPENILLSKRGHGGEVTVKISDYGFSKKNEGGRSPYAGGSGGGGGNVGWMAPEVLQVVSERNSGQGLAAPKLTLATDVFSLGCVFYYVLSRGGHPFGSNFIDIQYNIKNGSTSVIPERIETGRGHTLWAILAMISNEPRSRPNIRGVLSSPVFWSKKLVVQFILEVADCISYHRKECEQGIAEVETSRKAIFGGSSWLENLCPVVRVQLGYHRDETVVGLISAINELAIEYPELSKEVKTSLGSLSSGFVNYWVDRFPNILGAVWVRFQGVERLRKYYGISQPFPVGVFAEMGVGGREDEVMKEVVMSEDRGAYFSSYNSQGSSRSRASLQSSILNLSVSDNPPQIQYSLKDVEVENGDVHKLKVFSAVESGTFEGMKKVFRDYNETKGKMISDIWAPWKGVLQTPLHVAVRSRDYSVVEYIVERQGFRDVMTGEVISSERFRGLLHGCVEGTFKHADKVGVEDKIKIVKLLASINRALVNDKSANGLPPILVNGVHYKIILALIESGADPEVKTEEGWNMLHNLPRFITSSEYHTVVEFICGKNLKHLFLEKDDQSRLPLHFAVSKLELEDDTLDLLKSAGNVKMFNSTDLKGFSVVEYAIWGGRKGHFIENLVKLGARIDFPTNLSISEKVIRSAARCGNVSVLNHYIVNGTNLSVTWSGFAPIHAALESAKDNTLAVVKMLVEAGATVTQTTGSMKSSLLHYAAYLTEDKDIVEIIKYLIDKGVNPDAKDASNNTMMHIAAEYLKPEVFHEVVVHLINIGETASFHKKNDNGYMILHKSVWNSDPLLSSLKLLKERGGEMETKSSDGSTVMHLAITRKRSVECLENLVGLGVSCHESNLKRENPLHLATKRGNVSGIRFLVKNGCSVNATESRYGWTPLHCLLRSSTSPNLIHEMVQLLVQQGANVHLEDRAEMTPLDIAKQKEVAGELPPETVTLLRTSHN